MSDLKTIRISFNHNFSSVIITDYGKDNAQFGMIPIDLSKAIPSAEPIIKSTKVPLDKIKAVTLLTTHNPLIAHEFFKEMRLYCQKKKIPCFFSTFVFENCCEALSKLLVEKDHHVAIISTTAGEGLVYSILKHNGQEYVAVGYGELKDASSFAFLQSKLSKLPDLDKVIWLRARKVIAESDDSIKMIRKAFESFNFAECAAPTKSIDSDILHHRLGEVINPYFPAPMAIHPNIIISAMPGDKVVLETKEMFALPYKTSTVLDITNEKFVNLFSGNDSDMRLITKIKVEEFKGKKVKCSVEIDTNYVLDFKVEPVTE